LISAAVDVIVDSHEHPQDETDADKHDQSNRGNDEL